MAKPKMKTYTISDGDMVLTLTEAEEGGFVVTSPIDPELMTQAETIEEAFEMARDAAATLQASRVEMFRKMGEMQAAG
ncbi:MAG: type II toxin-antitoxin system HicB family antitoxin [Phycisphaeraceae bacterium]